LHTRDDVAPPVGRGVCCARGCGVQPRSESALSAQSADPVSVVAPRISTGRLDMGCRLRRSAAYVHDWRDIAMRRRASLVLSLAAVTLLAAGGFAQAPDPAHGTWELNLSKSTFHPGPAPKAETRIYEIAGTRLTITS